MSVATWQLRKVTPSGLWRDGAFVRLFAAIGISELGSEVSFLALPLAALYVLQASALQVALLRVAALVPLVVFALPVGVWVDRVRRRPLMVAADVARAVAFASIPVAFWLGHFSLLQLYVVVAIHGLLTVFFDLSFLSLLPGLVPHARLSEANSKLLGAQSAAGVAGPTLAGALVGFLGAAVAVLADAVSFAFSGALITSIRRREPKPKSTMTRTWDELVEGVRFVFAQPTLRTLTIWFSAWNLFSSGFFAILVVYYVRSLHLDAGTIGIVFAVSNVGIVIAAAVNERVVRRFGIGPVIAYFGPASDLCWIAFPLAPHAFPLPVLIGFGILGGMFGLLVNVNQLTLRQALTPPQLLGRMNSVVRLMYWGTIPIGATIGGVLAGPLGLRTTLVLTALLAVLAGLPITFSHIRRLSTIPETIATS